MRAAAAEASSGPPRSPADRDRRGRRHRLEPGQGASGGDRRPDADPERIAEIQAILATEPAAAAAARLAINPIRARILPAGAAIVDAILERYGANAIRVSEAGLREGAILAVGPRGSAWRDRLPDLAHGWRT